MNYADLADNDLLELFYNTRRELNDPTIDGPNRLLAAQLAEIGYTLHARGITPNA